MTFFQLYDNLRHYGVCETVQPIDREFRVGDLLHSQADIGKAKFILGYEPKFSLGQGLKSAVPWYVKNHS